MSFEHSPDETFDDLVGYAVYEHQPQLLVSRLLRAYGELDGALHEHLGQDHDKGEQLQVLSFGPGQYQSWMYFGRSGVDGSMYMSLPGVNNPQSPVVKVLPTRASHKYTSHDVDNLIVVAATLENTVRQIGKKGVLCTIKTVA